MLFSGPLSLGTQMPRSAKNDQRSKSSLCCLVLGPVLQNENQGTIRRAGEISMSTARVNPVSVTYTCLCFFRGSTSNSASKMKATCFIRGSLFKTCECGCAVQISVMVIARMFIYCMDLSCPEDNLTPPRSPRASGWGTPGPKTRREGSARSLQ